MNKTLLSELRDCLTEARHIHQQVVSLEQMRQRCNQMTSPNYYPKEVIEKSLNESAGISKELSILEAEFGDAVRYHEDIGARLELAILLYSRKLEKHA